MVNINNSMQKRHMLKRLGEHKVKLTNKHTRNTFFFFLKKGQKTEFHLICVLPGGKALDTEGLREASSVGWGQGSGNGYKG